jgi:ubiquinone biosynthesis protein COQ9
MIDDLETDSTAEIQTDALIDALADAVAFEGWTQQAVRSALEAIGAEPADAPLAFPGGAREMIEAHASLADRRMQADAKAADFGALRLHERVRAAIVLRLTRARPHKDAIRRALAILALPNNATLAARITARTVDAIWHAAGDASADFSWYTKRALLAGVYSSTLLYWLNDTSDDDEATLAFLDRRLGDVARIGKVRRRLEGLNPFRARVAD